MPYVKQERRPDLNEVIAEMVYREVKVDGDLNYILYKFCKENIKPSYNNYKNFIGELNETVAEIRRRLLAPYEDEAIERNGDV
jgi:hypothetical protein